MFFGNKFMDAEAFDFSTKEGRDKARKRLEAMLGNESPKDRRAAKILAGLFGVMDNVPDEFALVHEVAAECTSMATKLQQRSEQLEGVARLFEHGQPVHRMGMVDAYLTIAGGSLAAAAQLLTKLEGNVANRSVEKEENEGPSGSSETPTEAPPPPPPPVEQAAEAPLG